MQVFTQKKNNITGNAEWDVQQENYDYHQEIARSAFADMLHDTERNKKYYRAIQLAIQRMHESGKKANVLDIGTGTGLLSIMAVKCGADSVTACEAFKPMAECALKILQSNNVADKITVIAKRSTDLVVGQNGDLKEKANILVTEVFDTELIGEGAIGTFSHAHKCLLEEDCIVVPDSAVVYAQVIECPTLQKWNKLNDLADEDLDIILKTPSKMSECAGSAAVHDIQLSQLPRQAFRELSEQIPIFYYDWSGQSPIEKNKIVKQKLTAINAGKAQMVFMWWELNMDPEGRICLTCAPWWAHPDADITSQHPQDTIPWRDHWMQGVYYLPKEATIHKDSEVILVSCQDEYSIWFYLENENIKYQNYKRPICECGVHMSYSRTYVSYLNDGRRSKKFISEMKKELDSKSVVLDLNGTALKGLVAAKLGVKMVYCLEIMNLNLGILKDYVEENGLENIEFISGVDEDISKNITHVICDPNFSNVILPWENMRMAYLLFKIGLTGVTIIPRTCTFWAMPVRFLNLHKIRIPLNMCEGVDMSLFDEFIENSREISDQELEAQPLWEYPCLCSGKPEKIFTVDFYELKPTYAGDAAFSILEPGSNDCTMNAFAIWATWEIGGSTISSGPVNPPLVGQRVDWDPHTRQAVKILRETCEIERTDKWSYQLACDIVKGQFDLKIDLVKS